MKKYSIWFLCVVCTGLVLYYVYSTFGPSKIWQYAIFEKIVDGRSMYPHLSPWNKVRLISGYYTKNTPRTSDIVGYNYGGNKHMLIKIVRATSDDKILLSWNNLLINDKIMSNSAGEVYVFTPWELKLLWLYIKNDHIPEESYLLFGDNITDSIDSRKFWAIDKSDILGKFITKQ